MRHSSLFEGSTVSKINEEQISEKLMWDIDKKSGHVRHTNGCDAYFDPAKSHGLEIPFIGPFGSCALEAREIADLIQSIESEYPDRYVVCGKQTDDGDRSAKFIGVDATWRADYSFRTLLLESLGQTDQIQREWKNSPSGDIEHRTGPSFGIEDGVIVLLSTSGMETLCAETFMLAINVAQDLLCDPPFAAAI